MTMRQEVDSLTSNQTWLRRLARSMVRTAASADDLVQETCLAALRSGPAEADVRPWLRRVMRNVLWRRLRRDERRARREERFSLATSVAAGPDPALDYGIDRERLAEAVEALAEPFRSTVVRRFVEGLSCAEIARAEQVPASTIRWRQSRALELLRAELQIAAGSRSRGRGWLWLPMIGAAQELALGSARGLLATWGRNKAIWFALAGVAAFVALNISGGPGSTSRNRASDRLLRAPLRLGGAVDPDQTPTAMVAAIARASRGGPVLTSTAGPGAKGPLAGWIAGDARSRSGRRDQLDRLVDGRLRGRLERRARPGQLDPNSFLPGRPTCELVRRSLSSIDTTRSKPLMAFPKANHLLTAAMLASTALAASLGCSSDDDDRNQRESPVTVDGGPGDPGGADAGPGELDCRTQEGPNGESCAICFSPDNIDVTVICDPLECSALTMPDGTICTTCLEADGHYQTACDEPAGCTSTVNGFGLVCTTCPGRAEPECLPAECDVAGTCLECEDPKGRRATDCSVDYSAYAGVGAGFPNGTQFGGAYTSWGYPGGSFTGSSYPGINSCFTHEEEDVRCIVCRNGSGMCSPDPDDWVPPDPLGDRPANLPAPGTCAGETSADGLTQCLTCTREDLTAQVWCHHPEQANCQIDLAQLDELCWDCLSVDPNPDPPQICHPPVP